MIRHIAGTVAILAVTFLASGSAQQPPPRPVDDAALATPEARQQDWLSYGRDYYEQRFSPLNEISETNVDKLGLAWQFETATERGLEATPLVVDGVMYTTASWSVTYAIDARTGKQLWKYDPEVHRKYDNLACCDVVNRGAAFYKGKVIVGVLDGRLVALDANSGKVAWQTTTVDQTQPFTITGAPRIARGKVIIGNGGAEYGVRGYVSAYDAETGKLAWRFYTVPGDPSKPQENKALEKALPTWKGTEWFKVGGGGTVWDSIVYDPELNLLYVGTGNGSPWNRDLRSPGGGDNFYLCSILAINPDNGELVWHYQTTPADTWDYTSVQPMMLADMNWAGKPRKVIMQAPKNGFFYVLDRATGELLAADPYVEVNWATHVDLKTGRPVEVPGAAYKDKGTYIRPGPLGGHNWQAMSYSPRTGLVYIPAQDNGRYYEQPKDFTFVPNQYNLGVAPIGRNMDRYDIPYKGRLLAWDPVARKPRWTVEYGNYWNGGTLATAGNLVFQGTASGDFYRVSRHRRTEVVVVVGRHRHRRTADHLHDRRASIRVGDGGMGRRVFKEGAQLRAPVDVRHWRYRGAAVAAASAHGDRDRAQRHAAADHRRRKDLRDLLCALPRWRDDPSRPPSIDARHLHRARKDSRRLARGTRHAALCGAR